MKLHLHKHILKMIAGFFVISPSFVYAEGFRISLLPTQTKQVISCISFFAHKRSISDLTEFEYRKLLALANYELNLKTLPPLPNRIGESQMDVAKKLEEGMLEIVQIGISYDVYQEVLNYVKTSEENKETSSSSTAQTNRNKKVMENKSELEALKQKAKEVLLKYQFIFLDPNNLNLRNVDGATYLHFAAKANNLELVQTLLLLNPDLIDLQDEDGRTALFWAAILGHNDLIITLIENGADPNLQDEDGRTALMEAASNGHNDVVSNLLEKGADPNLQDKAGWTALFWTAADGHNDVVTTLLEKGVNPNLQDKNGWTALMEAASNGHNDVVSNLLEKGADPNLQNRYGETALMLAKDYTEIEELLRAYGAK